MHGLVRITTKIKIAGGGVSKKNMLTKVNCSIPTCESRIHQRLARLS